MRQAFLFSIALLGISAPAFAQMTPAQTGERDVATRADEVVDGPGNGLQLELNVFREAGAYSTDSIFAVGGTGLNSYNNTSNTLGGFISTLQPLASIGYQWNQNSLLLGVGVSTIGGTGSAGTTIFFGVTPTYRRYLSPLRTGKLSTFVEFGVTISLLSFPGAGGTGTDTGGYSDWGLGASLNFGAEWLFVRNFGLFGKAGVSYGHVSVSTGSSEPSGNVDAAGIQGAVGLAVHL